MKCLGLFLRKSNEMWTKKQLFSDKRLVLKPIYGEDYKEDEEEEEIGVDEWLVIEDIEENSELPIMSEILNQPGGKEVHELAIFGHCALPF